MVIRTAYFHEDDYCQIELVRDGNLAWCLDQTRRIGEFSDAHRAGDVWTKMYMRQANPVELITLGLTVETLTEQLSPHLPPFDEVQTGYSSHVEEAAGTLAFGSPDVTAFADHRDGVVSAIWFALVPGDEKEIEMAAAALNALAPWRLLLVDWGWREVIPLTDALALSGYLRLRMERFAQLREQFEHDRRQREAAASNPRPDTWLARLRRWFRS